MQIFKIARAGKTLFDLSGQDVLNGLAAGTVLPSDDYWTQGMSGWEKVSIRTNWTTPAPQSAPPSLPTSPTPSTSPTAVTRKGKVLDFNVEPNTGSGRYLLGGATRFRDFGRI